MKKVLSTIVCFCMLITLSFAQEGLTVEYQGCNSLSVTFNGTVLSNIYQSTGGTWCTTLFTYREHANFNMGGALYKLEKKGANGAFTMVAYKVGDISSATFTNVSTGTYRIQMLRRTTNGANVFNPGIPCTGSIFGKKYISDDIFFSSEIEIGTPVPSNIIFPAPTGNPAKICWSKINASNELLLLNGEASFGERAYFVGVFKDNMQGQNVGYASTGWVDGKISIVDLKSLNMVFEPGYKYTVQLALSQLPCTGWVNANTIFTIDGSCRESDEEVAEVSIFPNPTSDEINFSGLETWGGGDITVQVMDIMGKTVKTEILQAPNFTTSLVDLPAGTYLVNLRNAENAVTKKVVRQ